MGLVLLLALVHLDLVIDLVRSRTYGLTFVLVHWYTWYCIKHRANFTTADPEGLVLTHAVCHY